MATHDAIIAARMSQTIQANKHRCLSTLKEDNLVYLSTKNLNLPKGQAQKLVPKYLGPFLDLKSNHRRCNWTCQRSCTHGVSIMCSMHCCSIRILQTMITSSLDINFINDPASVNSPGSGQLIGYCHMSEKELPLDMKCSGLPGTSLGLHI